MTDLRGRVLGLARGALGDALIARSFLAALPAHFGAEGLSLVANPPALEVFGRMPFVVEVRDQNRAGWAGLYMEPPDVPGRMADFILSHKAGVVLARRPENDPAAAGLRTLGLNPVIAAPSAPPEGLRVHVEDYLFSETGITPPPVPAIIQPGEEDIRQAQAFLDRSGLDPGTYATLHPGSGGAGKNWPAGNWSVLGRMVRDEFSLTPIYVLGPAEEGFGDRFDGPAARGLPLPVLAAVMILGRGHIGHDTGITHLAASYGVPALALFGPSDPAVWSPRGGKVRALAPPDGFDPARSWDWLRPDLVVREFGRLVIG